jgi:cell wall-associated NlpC family hydrolase
MLRNILSGMIVRILIPVIVIISVVFIIILIGAAAVLMSSEVDQSIDDAGNIYMPVFIMGEVESGKITLRINGAGIDITNIEGLVSPEGNFSASNHLEASSPSQEMELPPAPPAKLNYFSWMPQFNQDLYSYHLDHDSAQYKFNEKCVDDEEGFRRYGDAYLVALGTFYGTTIGEQYTLKFLQDNGSELSIKAVRGDTKSDSDTDALHQYHVKDGSIVEFIMSDRTNRNGRAISNKFGTLISISKGIMQVTLTGIIKDVKVTISGTIDGIPVNAEGTITSGKIVASGFWGSGDGDGGVYGGVPLTDETYRKLMDVAMAQLGKPYVFGAKGPDSFDCSGFVQYCYKNALGKNLPGSAAMQAGSCNTVNAQDIKPGDLVFFQGTYKQGISHVGIYIGNNKMIHAGGSEVHYSDITGYYIQHFHSYGRVN